MRFLVSGFLLLCFAASPAFSATDDPLRYGVQTSMNSYHIDDPVGQTATGSGLSLGGIALLDVGRDSRLMFNLNRDTYTLAGSSNTVGQNVSSLDGGLSYQKMLRVSRTWKPWVGAGLGYSSTTYRNRFTVTPGGFSTLYADRTATAFAMLLNANSEWQLNRDWDMGLQAQLSKSISDKSGILSFGIYVVY
jgi:hypothetical protein